MALNVNRGKIDWDEALVERLKILWDEGIPASKIARMIGQGATKNSIIGKAHRLRLRMRHPSPGSRLRGTHPRGVRRPIKRREPRPSRARHAPAAGREAPPVVLKPAAVPDTAPAAKPLPPRPPPPPPPPPVVEPRLPQGTYTLLDLGPHECRWPMNAPPRGSAAYFFCGEPSLEGRPYCVLHCKLGYQMGSALRRPGAGAWYPKPVETV